MTDAESQDNERQEPLKSIHDNPTERQSSIEVSENIIAESPCAPDFGDEERTHNQSLSRQESIAAESKGKKLSRVIGSGRRTIKEKKGAAALWVFNLLVGAIVGYWLNGVVDCRPKAQEKVKHAIDSVGYLGDGDICLILPPAGDGENNKGSLTVARESVRDAEKALSGCKVGCLFGNCCRDLWRKLKLADANLDLLTGDCAGALAKLEYMKRENMFGAEEAVTWAWAKVESDPSEDSYRQSVELLNRMPEDACVATTKGSLLRRLALSQEENQQRELLLAALREHDLSIKLEPRSVLANYNRAIVFLDLKDPEKAQQALDAANDYLGTKDDPYWHSTQATIHAERGNQQAALDELNTAIETGVPNVDFRLSRGWLLYSLGRYLDAMRDFSRAQEMLTRKESSCQTLPIEELEEEIQRGLAKSRQKIEAVEERDHHKRSS